MKTVFRSCWKCGYRTVQRILSKTLIRDNLYFYKSECTVCKMWNTSLSNSKDVGDKDEKEP